MFKRFIAVTIIMASAGAVHAGSSDSVISEYYESALMQPSKRMLLAEARGRVTIYDGINNDVVEPALDEQFDRIDNMMFVRTQYNMPDGSIMEEEDCD